MAFKIVPRNSLSMPLLVLHSSTVCAALDFVPHRIHAESENKMIIFIPRHQQEQRELIRLTEKLDKI